MKRKYVLIILAAMLTFNCVSVYAAGSAQKSETKQENNVLTVDEAVNKAVAYSRTLKSLYENNEINELSASDTRTSLINSNEYIQLTNLNVELKNLLNSIRNYDANVAVEKESIKLNVIELFAAIINAENEVELYDKQIALDEKDLKIAQVKSNLGLLSQNDYDSLKISVEKSKNSKQSLQIALEEAYTSLNKMLGQNLTNQYKVELEIDYEPLGETDIDYAVAKAVSSSQSIKEKEEAAEIARYQLDVYSVEYSGGYKESKRNNYAQASRELADAKTQMESALRTVYNNIQTAETNYSNNIAALEQSKKELEIKAVQLKLGKITQLEYDKAEYELEKLENTIKQSVYDHYILVCKYNNPDLI